ncbi:DUF3100 domain-containing protein [Salmonella enterica subsp. enterica serovar Morehead]|nr:DUF3100 domain-containing protein [Salmonella enterica subsp. enterica serovar Newport]EBY2753089.1 DUF3100 domain-containing protein [Salmonella enterica subsp. enterica serovar Kottbus]EEM2539455.1 DUF3100 domain-containing protein [Salmonella enterica subsp. enterica serovar Morehead]EHN5888774.1 DUF3100 domain-containing protein [Salmonella enterica subsp. enterica serovar Newport]
MKNILSLMCAVLIILIVAELIGPLTINIGNLNISFLPMLYAVIIGIIVTPDLAGKVFIPLRKVITDEVVTLSGKVVMIALLPLGVRYGNLISGSIDKVVDAGPALILQELGNLASVIIAIPLAYMLGMRREAIGACSSISREPSLGVIGEKYGTQSPEGMGVMGVYILGSVIGTIFFGVISPIGLTFGFNPLSLAAACGLGSGSMLAACTSALAAARPELADTIVAYGAVANTVAGLTGVYILIFIGLPLANFIYGLIDRKHEATK